MPKKKKFNEASTTAQIKGFLASRKAFANAELYDGKKKKKKNKEKPWYMKTMNEVHQLVLEEIAERKRLLTEAGELSNNPELHIKELERAIPALQQQIEADPNDATPRRQLAQIQRQIQGVQKAVEMGGERWRDFLLDPKGTKQRDFEKSEFEKSNEPAPKGGEYEDFAREILTRYAGEADWPKGKEAVISTLLKNLRKYIGDISVSRGEHEKIESWIANRLIGQHKGNVADYVQSREASAYSKKAKGATSGKMRARPSGGKYSAPGAPELRKPGRSLGDKMPGATPSLKQLFDKLSQDPEHARSPFVAPGGSGKGFEPGPGRILQKVYQKLIKGDPQKGVEGIVDPRDLADVDPEVYGIKKSEFTEFEKALGPYLRKLYGKKGYQMDRPGDESLGGSGAKTLPMKRLLAKAIGVKFDDLESKSTELKNDNPAAFANAEQQALTALKKLSQKTYEQEMEMRKKREKAVPDEDEKDFSTQEMEDVITAKLGSPLSELDPESAALKKSAPDQWDAMVRRLFSRIVAGEKKPEPEKFTKPGDPEPWADDDTKDTLKSLEKVSAREKGPTKSKSTKAQRRAFARSFDEPRDPEETERRKELEPVFRSKPAEEKAHKKAKEKRLALIKKRHDIMKKKVGESLDFNISELFEGFENSYDIDVKAPEEEWEDGETPAKKDWAKDLSLESLYHTLSESPLDKQRQLRGGDPQKWLDDEGESSETLKTANVPDGWGKGNEPSAWLTVGKHAGRLGRDIGEYEDNERDDETVE